MKKYGLIGKILGHSFSQDYFRNKFNVLSLKDHAYENFELKEIEQVSLLLKDDSIGGFNVTIPYKEAIIPYLDDLDDVAKAIGAVNTINRTKEGALIGFNTDQIGFRNSLDGFLNVSGLSKSALILGTGGAAKAVEYVLRDMDFDIQYVSRTNKIGAITYEQLDKERINSTDLIINTTPLGTHPNINDCPSIPYEYLTERQHLYDLVYNPEWTKFLKFGQQNSCPVQNGLKMLQMQAEAAWLIWNK